MEGNYRIVQLADNEFVIEKEVINVIKHPWYKFKKESNKSHWRKVNEKGKVVTYYALIGLDGFYYMARDLKTCQDRLRQILKYPEIIEYASMQKL